MKSLFLTISFLAAASSMAEDAPRYFDLTGAKKVIPMGTGVNVITDRGIETVEAEKLSPSDRIKYNLGEKEVSDAKNKAVLTARKQKEDAELRSRCAKYAELYSLSPNVVYKIISVNKKGAVVQVQRCDIRTFGTKQYSSNIYNHEGVLKERGEKIFINGEMAQPGTQKTNILVPSKTLYSFEIENGEMRKMYAATILPSMEDAQGIAALDEDLKEAKKVQNDAIEFEKIKQSLSEPPAGSL